MLDLLAGLLVIWLRVCLGVVRLFGGVFSCWLLSNSVFCVWVVLGVFTGVYFGLRAHF